MADKTLPNNTLEDARVFLVDDEDILAWTIENELKSQGATVRRTASLRETLKQFPCFSADVAITDLSLPDGNGLELLKKWRHEYPELPVILITAHGAIDSAITALRYGAFDYLQKPFDIKALVTAVKRGVEISQLRQKVSRLQGRVKEKDTIEIIGSSPPMKRLLNQLAKVAKSRADTILIEGESGTGKELAARAIHLWSERVSRPFVEINCASIPESLLESELFGHERGAFTDARDRKLGLFEMARDGTIFLDEIGEMPMKLQSKLLRVLEYRRFKRLGGVKDIEFSAQIVAATNRNLLQEIKASRFREDLFYRLNVLPIKTPPLRERLDDISELTDYLLRDLCTKLSLPVPTITEEALHHLRCHSWPGNVRELRNLLQRALVFYEPEVISPEHLEIENLEASIPNASKVNTLAQPTSNPGEVATQITSHRPLFSLPDSGVSLDGVEKTLILQALEKTKNNQTKAAKLLGVTRHTLRYRLEKHGLVH